MARALTSIRQMSMIPPSEGTFNESCDPISFFSLAEKLELPALQNLVMDTTIQCHKDNRQLPSIDFAERAFDETRNGSTISKYAVRAMRYFLQVQAQDNDHDWTMGAMADVLGNHRSISIEFLDLVRQGAIKDPRKTSRDFHVPLAPADVHTPSQNRIAPSVTPSGQVSSKRQRSVHQAKSRTKRQRIDVPVRHEPVANEGRVKQEYSGSNSILGDLGGEKTTAVGGQELLARILDDERMVFNILLDEPQHGHGLHVKDIAKKSAGLTVNDVFKAGDVLLGEGLIYTTADNETWAVLEY
jgi:hypothetical protein